MKRQLERGVAIDALDRALDVLPVTPLMAAAASRRGAGIEMLQFLLHCGADLNARTEAGTPIGMAAKSGNIEKVRFLLDEGSDINAASPSKYTALINASCGTSPGKGQIIRLLLDHSANPDVCTDYGETALGVLSSRGEFEPVRSLLQAGANPAPLGWTALHFSAAFGDADEVRSRAKASPDELAKRDRQERTPWLIALVTGDRAKAEAMLKLGSSINDASRCGLPLLAHPCQHDHGGLVRWLIERGADPNATDDFGNPVIVKAASLGAWQCVRELLAAGANISGIEHRRDSKAVADVQSRMDQQLQQILDSVPQELRNQVSADMLGRLSSRENRWYAITESSNLAVVKEILNAGGHLDQIDDEGYCVLKSAVEQGDIDMVRGLLDLGATIDNTSTGATALHKAIGMDDLEIARLLLERGANVNAIDVDGQSPLHWARSDEVAELLLASGCDPAIKDQAGRTAAESIRDPFVRERVSRLTQGP